jgi:glycosyltransferase involved in cell wall biosynthesis
MKLFLDLQAIQGASRNRGIGRYSFEFAKAIVRNRGGHEIWLGASNRFPVPWQDIADIAGGQISRDRILVMSLPGDTAEIVEQNRRRMRIAELVRETAIAQIRPDVCHLSSLFEGLAEDNTASIGTIDHPPASSVTLYDLIPLIRPEIYLSNDAVRGWYYRKIDSLKRADRLLAISESAAREAATHLGVNPDRISVIHAGVSNFFKPVQAEDPATIDYLRRKGLQHPFVMYTGGIEPRKNIEGLIAAFAALPRETRQSRQLAIVCKVQLDERNYLLSIAREKGMREAQLVLTDFVSDEELRILYSACELFVFPSLHEGFGLPIVEAMACGAPVIASNTSSMPEVIGRKDALFDPRRPSAIAAKMNEVLSCPKFARSLRESGSVQSRRFTWDNTALTAWEAFAQTKKSTISAPATASKGSQPRLAYFSPLPPEPSGISDYSVELLPELARHYDVHCIVDQNKVTDRWIAANLRIGDFDWFERHAASFDCVVYNFGNSVFHARMVDLIARWPGVVILHDFYLSGLFRYLGIVGDPTTWFRSLYDSHGIPALRSFPSIDSALAASEMLPCSRFVFEHATSVVVHSNYARNLASNFFGKDVADCLVVMPFPRRLGESEGRSVTRQRLGLGEDDLLVCSFGFIAETKLTHRMLDAWHLAELDRDEHCHLVLVGSVPPGAYGKLIEDRVAKFGNNRVKVTGFVERETYHGFLQACDLAVQLRTGSRGESSASAMDCMAHRLPMIINAHGSAAELRDDATVKVAEDFSNEELAASLRSLLADPARRKRIGTSAHAEIRDRHQPHHVADILKDIVESSDLSPNSYLNRLASRIGQLRQDLTLSDLSDAALAIAGNRRTVTARQLLLDVSVLATGDFTTGMPRAVLNLVDKLTRHPPGLFRPEPVTVGAELRYARSFAMRHFGLPDFGRTDTIAHFGSGDIFLGLRLNLSVRREVLERFRERNVGIYFVLDDLAALRTPGLVDPAVVNSPRESARLIVEYASGVICTSPELSDQLYRWLEENPTFRSSHLRIGHLAAGFGTDDAKVAANIATESARQLLSFIVEGNWDRVWCSPSGNLTGSLDEVQVTYPAQG